MKSNSISRTAMALFLAMFTTTVVADVNFGNVLEKGEINKGIKERLITKNR